jgi:hypothetical protein
MGSELNNPIYTYDLPLGTIIQVRTLRVYPYKKDSFVNSPDLHLPIARSTTVIIAPHKGADHRGSPEIGEDRNNGRKKAARLGAAISEELIT